MMPQSLQSRHLGTSHSSPSISSTVQNTEKSSVVMAISWSVLFPECHWRSEISAFSKVILVLGKASSHRAPNLGCRAAESTGWFDVSPENSAGDIMHEWSCCPDKAANHHLPIAVAFWIIQMVSGEECSSLTQNLMLIHCSTGSVILNVMATQYTSSLNGVYHPYWLIQLSLHCSHTRAFQSTFLG